jgi:hypothetical protein
MEQVRGMAGGSARGATTAQLIHRITAAKGGENPTGLVAELERSAATVASSARSASLSMMKEWLRLSQPGGGGEASERPHSMDPAAMTAAILAASPAAAAAAVDVDVSDADEPVAGARLPRVARTGLLNPRAWVQEHRWATGRRGIEAMI